jgi:biotin-dependent carboxylase-like uncharacterized protein
MSFTILEPGLATLLVDAGRPRTRSLGVPVSGAADRVSWMLGNAMLGNPLHAAALEFALAGPRLQATADVACTVFGAMFELTINDQAINVGTTFTLSAGDVLHVGKCYVGMRGYLCVMGGFQGESILGSQSSLALLATGDTLRCAASRVPRRGVAEPPEQFRPPHVVRVMPGPQVDWFPSRALTLREFTVASASNRMGVRLEGPRLPAGDREMLSEPVAPGTVQVTREGQPIILGVEGQTLGGYPKIAQVIHADLDHVGQLRPGDTVQFESVSAWGAQVAAQARHVWLREWIVRLRLAAES